MNRDQAVKIVRAHESELRARGVTRLAIFGSTARGQARLDSDIDVLVDFDDKRKLSLLDLAGLQLYLCDILGREVEVTQRKGLKPLLRDDILAEAIEVFPCRDGQSPQPKGVPMPRESYKSAKV
ncbi:MAG: nucleotidyltransferase family protein [Kiloniellales bacterium]